MARIFLFADEAGDFSFKRVDGASRYFIVGTVTMSNCDLGEKLLRLRRELSWEGSALGDYFHACKDKQAVRDRVFALLSEGEFKIQATVMEKSKAQPQVRSSDERFYQYGWFYHFKNSRRHFLSKDDELQIAAASIGTKKGQVAFTAA